MLMQNDFLILFIFSALQKNVLNGSTSTWKWFKACSVWMTCMNVFAFLLHNFCANAAWFDWRFSPISREDGVFDFICIYFKKMFSSHVRFFVLLIFSAAKTSVLHRGHSGLKRFTQIRREWQRWPVLGYFISFQKINSAPSKCFVNLFYFSLLLKRPFSVWFSRIAVSLYHWH